MDGKQVMIPLSEYREYEALKEKNENKTNLEKAFAYLTGIHSEKVLESLAKLIGIDKDTGQVKACWEFTKCEDCLFGEAMARGSCIEAAIEWLKKEAD